MVHSDRPSDMDPLQQSTTFRNPDRRRSGAVQSFASILVNPAKWPHVKFSDARTWHEWLTSQPGADAIANYRINGMQVFSPLGNEKTH